MKIRYVSVFDYAHKISVHAIGLKAYLCLPYLLLPALEYIRYIYKDRHLYSINTFPWRCFTSYYIISTDHMYSWILQSHKVSSKSDQKQKFFIPRTFFVNKQLTLFFNYLKKHSLNFAQNFRECSFNLAGSESGEKSKRAQLFAYISQLFVYKTRLWT